jgi:amino acid permease
MKKTKRILCIIGVILLVSLYLITLFFSIFDHTQAKSWLSASLYATFLVPIILYAFFLITKPLSDRRKEADAMFREKEESEKEDK